MQPAALMPSLGAPRRCHNEPFSRHCLHGQRKAQSKDKMKHAPFPSSMESLMQQGGSETGHTFLFSCHGPRVQELES